MIDRSQLIAALLDFLQRNDSDPLTEDETLPALWVGIMPGDGDALVVDITDDTRTTVALYRVTVAEIT